MKITLATRGSALALAQVELAKLALTVNDPTLEITVQKITTTGDRKFDLSLLTKDSGGVKGLFTKEIESALLAGEAAVAVHSLKDMPGDVIDERLVVAAVLPRASTADLLIAKNARSLDELPNGATVATSSVRRAKQLRWLRADLKIEEIRGNVPTRLQKLRDSQTWDAIVLAKAGIERLGIDLAEFAVSEIEMLPAIGQGAIALQCRVNDEPTRSRLAAINHAPTSLCTRAERELLRLLQGDCHLPVGATTELRDGKIWMRALVFDDAAAEPQIAEAEGDADAPEQLAAKIFKQLHG